MKYIKSYKIFEDNDDNEDNEIPGGFEYSWNDIKQGISLSN